MCTFKSDAPAILCHKLRRVDFAWNLGTQYIWTLRKPSLLEE